ncbi:Pentatricopeptide repeat [Macleaya cordata]|uniref:Pentatricopeptide repeat n=1 Tax=Macleaya cordata TaxID=56857 RepID=A0A200QHA2_MACCD|nr:Pentatricopeptide repeat [Macleaya cordata]
MTVPTLLTKNPSFLFSFKPNEISASLEKTIKLLKISADTRNLRFGKTLHSQLIIANQSNELNVIQTNCLINLYVKCGEISVARKLFDQMPERNVVSWNALMAGYLHSGLASEALKLFKTMNRWESLRPNEYIFATVLASCSDIRALEEGKQCHGYVLKSGLVFHLYVKNALLDMYSRCSDVEGAMSVLKTVPGSDILSYNSIISGFLENGYLNEGLEVLRKMVDGFFVWDNFTHVTMLGLCASLKDLKLGLQIHNQILRREIEFDVFLGSAIIDMYGKCGKILNAKNVFYGLQERNVVLWTAIMVAYAHNRYFEEALNHFLEMELAGILPNEYTFAVMLNSCAGLSALRHGGLFHSRAEKSGFKDHLNVGNALINMYSKSGSIEDARRVFSDMIHRDTITWNSMISGYSHHGLGREALLVFHQMLASFGVPNYITFVGVLSACGHLGLVDEGFYYLNHLMENFGIKPGVEHYTCIVGLLGRAGLLTEAENLMKSNPIKWDVVAWRTLLSACHVHRNFGLGKKVADVILELDPNDVATYILLSNMYAKAKRWDGVVNIRKLMRGREIKKEPGVSWIQVKNNIHVFVSEDKKHLESQKIHEKVSELLSQIKMLGYVPDIASVLHDVGDEQKEEYLSYHSEKLAVAFGLMNTPSGAPIHVIKNLRMCDDCHTAVKLISKVTKRKIIVRDANRFHCFESGTCSCGDYW